MNRNVRPTFGVESSLASCSAFLAALTAVWHDWVEGIVGFDPHRHDGWFEWEVGAHPICFT